MTQTDFNRHSLRCVPNRSTSRHILNAALTLCAVAFSACAGDALTWQTPITESESAQIIGVAITVTPTTLPNGKAGAAYGPQQISASGGVGPYTFSTAPATTLPPGLSISASGVLSGTPTAVGTFSFGIKATDSTPSGNGGPFSGTRNYTITTAAPTLTISPTAFTNANIGQRYTTPITVSGGTAPFTYAITSGALPPGLTLTSAGVVTGTPTTEGYYTFTITVTDSTTRVSAMPTMAPSGEASALVAAQPTGFSASANYSLLVDAVPVFPSGAMANTALAPTLSPNNLVTHLSATFSTSVSPSDANVTWDFGDGSQGGPGTLVTHTYAVAGDYTVTVSGQNPRSGSIGTTTFTVHVTDTMIGSNSIRVRNGTIHLGPTVSRIRLNAIIHLNQNEKIGGSLFQVYMNGVTRTFTLSPQGKSNFPNGKAAITFGSVKGVVGSQESTLILSFIGSDIPALLRNGTTLDANGYPEKVLFQVVFNGRTLTFVTPVKFKKSGPNASATFGIK